MSEPILRRWYRGTDGMVENAAGDWVLWSEARAALAAQAPQAAEPVPLDALRLVREQAEDEGLWFIARTAPEGYLQAALRNLHAAVEAAPQAPAAQPLTLELIQANGEFCVSLNDYRIAGPKPWAGGALIRRWLVSAQDINSALRIAPSAQGEQE